MRLSYNKVFDRYKKSFTDNLAELSFELYSKTRLRFAKLFPLSENEKFQLYPDHSFQEDSSKMPKGYNLITKEEEEGYLKLEYIDFFDYLPKEDLSRFIKELKSFVSSNKINPFGLSRTRDEMDVIDNLGKYLDGKSFSNVLSVLFTKNKYLKKYCRGLAVSLRNLSSTFLAIKFRVYISDDFNSIIQKICKTEYSGYTEVYRRFDIPWFSVKRFGRSYHTGDECRQKELYTVITKLKWETVKELKKKITIHFWNENMFPPTFETYSTNIRPKKDASNSEFWRSVLFERLVDYSTNYNACVCWEYNNSKYEGKRLAAYCGGNYSDSDYLPDIAKHDLSDIYVGYLTAIALNNAANRNIEKCNKKISKVIRKNKTASLLKLRVKIERKLYYCYRFISEFSGKSIDDKEGKSFFHQNTSESLTSLNLKSISKWTKDSKEQIDIVLKLLNDAAEYRSSKSNNKTQWIMLIVTVLALVVAVLSINNTAVKDFFSCVWNWISNLFT